MTALLLLVYSNTRLFIIIFLPSAGSFGIWKAPTSRPLRETKLPLSGDVEQKNSIQTLASKKGKPQITCLSISTSPQQWVVIYYKSGFGSVVECLTWDSRVVGSNPPLIWPKFFPNFFRQRRTLRMRISNPHTNRWRIRFFRAFQSCEKWGKRRASLGVSLLPEANRDFSSPAEALAHA